MRFNLEWRLKPRKWTVIHADASSGLKVTDILQLDSAAPDNLTVTSTLGSASPWGRNCRPQPGSDADKVLLQRGGSDVTVRRGVCLIGPPLASGGASWVAEEGG